MDTDLIETRVKAKPVKKLKTKIKDILLWLPRRISYFVGFCYYRSYYYLVYKLRISEFVFIDFRVLLIIVVIMITLYSTLYETPLFLGLPSLSTELYIVESTLRTTSIFIGIVFSFVLLSFNVFYRYFGRLTFIKFFTSRHIKFIFTLFIADLILLLYTCGYLKEAVERDSYGDGLFIISLSISGVLVLSIIPTLILLLRSSQNRDNIQQLINKFDKEWSFSNHVNMIWKEDKNRLLQRDPITLLTEIGTAAIKDFDKTSLASIKDGCLLHLEKLHGDYQKESELHPYSFYDKLYELARNLFPIAIKERNESAALIIMNLLLEVEEFYVQHFKDFNVHGFEEHHYDGIKFTVVIREFLVKALQFNEDNVSERIISGLRGWWILVIKLYLLEIKYSYPENERFPTDKTSFFISTTYYEFGNIFEQVFAYKKSFLYKEIALFFKVLDMEIISSKNIRSSIVYLLQKNGQYNLSVFEKFVGEACPEISLFILIKRVPYFS